MRKPGQFRDKTALETLMEGEREAMEGLGGAALAMSQVAGTIDARFAAIEARLTALEEGLRIARLHPYGQAWSPDTAPVHQVSEELRQKLARDANEPQARHEPDAGVRGVERDDPAV
jgi:hypothetical protein